MALYLACQPRKKAPMSAFVRQANYVFGPWLEQQLKEREWSQGEFGRRSGYNSGQISHWIKGTRTPTARSCQDIADALGLPVQIVLEAAGRDVKQSNIPAGVDLHDPLIDFFGQNLDKLTPEDREELMRFGLKLLEERGEL